MSTTITTEVVTAAEVSAADLQAHAETINQTLDLIVMHEDAFEESTLEPRLLIGLEIAKAQEVFGMSKAEAGSIGGSMPQRGMLDKDALSQRVISSNPLGFSAWIGRNIPRLPRSTAQKYATAFKALGIATDHATPAAIRAKIKDIRHHCGKNKLPMPTLSGLYKAGKPAKTALLGNSDEEPKEDPTRLGDAREAWFLWREKAEKLVTAGVLDDLDKPGLEELKEFNLWFRDKLNARLKNA